MSQNIINTLPVEVLTMCFMKFKLNGHLNILNTCAHWYDVLSTERFVRLRCFRMYWSNAPAEDDPDNFWNCEKTHNYRALEIVGPLKQLDTVRAYLSREQVRNNMQQLLLTVNQQDLVNLFGQPECWPSLRRIICKSTDLTNDDAIVMNAPELRHLKLVGPPIGINPFVKLFSGQIQDLSLASMCTVKMLQTIESGTFENLYSLTLTTRPASSYSREPQIFATSHEQIFAQLRNLTITDDYGELKMILVHMLTAAVNLEKLLIACNSMPPAAFNAINKMERLQALCLFVRQIEDVDLDKLSLPNLEKLAISLDTFIPIASVPKLKWLCIENSKWWWPKNEHVESIQSTLRLIGPPLEVLYLMEMDVDPWLIKSMRELKSLRLLEMRQVQLQEDTVDTILRAVPTLRSFSMFKCDLMQHSKLNESWFDNGRQNLNKGGIEELLQRLKPEHPDVAIEDVDNSCTRRFTR